MIRTSLKKELSGIKNINVDDCVEDYMCSLLSSIIFSAKKSNEKVIEFDIGIGVIVIYLVNDSINYRFEPSHILVDKIKESFEKDEDPIINNLNDKIEYSLYRIYRELLR